MGSTKQEQQKKSVLRWGWGRGRGRDPCPSGGASSSGDADAEEESRKAHSTLELLSGSELQCSGCFHRSSHTTPGCGYLELFRMGPSWRKLPAVCRDQNVVEGGQVKMTLENCESINLSQVRVTTLPSIGIQEQYPSHSLGIPKSLWLVKTLPVVLCMSVNSTVIQTFTECWLCTRLCKSKSKSSKERAPGTKPSLPELPGLRRTCCA